MQSNKWTEFINKLLIHILSKKQFTHQFNPYTSYILNDMNALRYNILSNYVYVMKNKIIYFNASNIINGFYKIKHNNFFESRGEMNEMIVEETKNHLSIVIEREIEKICECILIE